VQTILLLATLSLMSKIGPSGVGPIVFGMTPAQAAATGTHLTPYGPPALGGTCYYVRSPGLKGFDFMVEGGTLRRIDVLTPDMQTVDGFRVGDPALEVQKFYGRRASIFPEKYDPHAHIIEVVPKGSEAAKFRTLFFVKNSLVYKIIAGALPQVHWVERCG
jgi:hypothetical protein